MSDPALRENKPNKASASWLVLYLVLVLAVLAVGLLVRTMGTSPVSFAATFDTDTIIYDRFGTELGRLHPEDNMIPVTLEEMSPILVDAVLIALDPQYLDGGGVEPWSLLVAVLTSNTVDPQPTITQRLVRSINGSAGTRLATLREASVVIQLEQNQPREALLEQYLSQVPLGRSAFGVEAASRAWYGKSASDLGIGQAAHLASLMRGFRGEDSSERGRNQILVELYQAGLITQDELLVQRTIPLSNLLIPAQGETPISTLLPDAGLSPYLQRIYGLLVERSGSDPVTKGQLEVESALDLSAQKAVASIVKNAGTEFGLDEIMVVVLDDRSHLRAMYATNGSLAEQARIDSEEVLKPFRRWKSFGVSLNWSSQITALELAQGHALVARGGRGYETQILLEVRSSDGKRIDRINNQISSSLDVQTASEITELLAEIVTSGPGFGAHLEDVVVIGSPGVNADGDLIWFGGSSPRFSVGLWISLGAGGAPGSDAGRSEFVVDETAAARLAGEVLRELHRDG